MTNHRLAADIADALHKACDLGDMPPPSSEKIRAWANELAPYGFTRADLEHAVSLHYRESTRRLGLADLIERARQARKQRATTSHPHHANPDCPYCDELGWLIDRDDHYGWAIRCDHTGQQLITTRNEWLKRRQKR